MHILLTAFGSYGDVHPLIGLGVALKRRGHQVAMVANPYFADEIDQAGLTLLPLGTREEYLQLTSHPDLWHRTRGGKVVLSVALEYLRPLYELLLQNYRPGQTVIAAHGLDFASRLLHEKVQVPVAAATFAPTVLWSAEQPPRSPLPLVHRRLPAWWNETLFRIGERLVVRPFLGPAIQAQRARIGLPRLQGRILPDWWYAVDVTLGMFPQWFAPRAKGWPQNLVCTGFPLWDGGQARGLSDRCQEFLAAGEAPLVFMPGSGNSQASHFFKQAVLACQRLGRRGVLLSKFPAQIPSALPAEILHSPFEPLTHLLPRSAAFVHHAGIGSSAQALAAGVPQLVRPMAFDQHDNALRLRKLGVAEELSLRQFTATKIAEKMQRLLTSGHVADACRRYQSQCDGPVACQAAADVLETMHARRADQ